MSYNTNIDLQKVAALLTNYKVGLYCEYINKIKKLVYLQNNQHVAEADTYTCLLQSLDTCVRYKASQTQFLVDLLSPLVDQVLDASYKDSNIRHFLYHEGISGLWFAIETCTCNTGCLRSYFSSQIEQAIQNYINIHNVAGL